MTATNPKVDFYFKKEKKWKAECEALRSIVLECDLNEQLKWGQPCYTTDDNRNVVLIHGFKEYCALLFMKGALMKDPKRILIQQTENVQSGRQIRFTDLKEIVALAPTLKTYIRDAIKIEKAGLKVEHKTTAEYKMPEELENKFKAVPSFKTAFYKLTPRRQRGYILYFSSAKQSKTREARIENNVDNILAGKGWNE